ncbi:MAG: OmpA family protein [Steroidobacteraceae bacterium]|jgi:outer membrane protein OmpA-like peptidoglycan-associated protein|nr:OmpA family protein [Steroidobacteraceae bacterium]
MSRSTALRPSSCVARLVLGLVLAAPVSAADLVAGADPPGLSRYQDATLVGYGTEPYAELQITRRYDTGPGAREAIAGRVTTAYYRLPAATPLIEAFRNYEAALRSGGFQVTASCRPPECRNGPLSSPHFDEQWSRRQVRFARGMPEGTRYVNDVRRDTHVLVAERRVNGRRQDVTVALFEGPPRYGLEPAGREFDARQFAAVIVVDEAPPALGKVKVYSAQELGAALAAEGRQVLYGLYFDTDSAVLKPESAPQLSEIAQLLKAQSGLSLFVVGHTDSTGSLLANEALSGQRAKSVVNALVAQGVVAGRLTPRGVGPFAPVASNADEQGRALNRRVELVVHR